MYIEPRSPEDSGCIESSSGNFQDETLDRGGCYEL